MNHCTQCGGELQAHWLQSENRQRLVCSTCQTIAYDNPRILVWCYVHWRQQVVFCRRAEQPARGYWNPPGGFVEKGEALETAVVREVREEVGLWLSPGEVSLFRIVSVPHMNEVHVGFRCALPAEPTLVAGPESLEVALFSAASFPGNEMAFRGATDEYPYDFYECLRTGDFPIRSVIAPSKPWH